MSQEILRRCSCLAAISTLLAGLANAQTLSTPGERTLVPPVRPFQLAPRVGVIAEQPLSLQQALTLALANNKDVEASRIDQQEADYSVLSAKGVYDTVFAINNLWEKQVNPVASTLGGSSTGALLTRMWQFDPGFSGYSPWLGGSYRTDLSNERIFTNNTFITLNPQYPTLLSFEYTQPLWRGLRYDTNRHAIEVAKKNRSLTDEQFRQRVMAVVDQTEQAYWELTFAYNNLQVQLQAVEIGREQDESNRRQEEQGLLAPIDVVAAQTQLANFELAAYNAQTMLTRAENNLKTIILPDRESPLWSTGFVPSTPVITEAPIVPLATAVQEALANRPEAAEVNINSEINQKDTRLYREQAKPQVDVTASYSRAGLAGAQVPPGPNPITGAFGPLIDRLNTLSAAAGLSPINLGAFGGSTTPALLVGGYSESLGNLWAGNFPTAEVQLRISLPLRNRTAEANVGRALAEGRKLQNQKEQVAQVIEADVRNSMQAIQSAQMALTSAQIARASAEQQYESEQRQFRAGTSTLFLVQQRQSAMIAARSQERRAQADLAEAIAQFEFATASNLRAHNVTLK